MSGGVHLYIPTPLVIARSVRKCSVCKQKTRQVTYYYAAWTTWACCRCGTHWDPSANERKRKPKPADKADACAKYTAHWNKAKTQKRAWDEYERETAR